MTTLLIRKKLFSVTFFTKTFLFLTLILGVSCETEEFVDSTESELKDVEALEKVTPVVGRTYYLRNRRSGLHMDVSGASNKNGANVQQWGNASGTHRQWEVISTGNGYVRLKGVDSGKSITAEGGNNANGTNIEIRSYSGASHQQWEIRSTGSGFFRLKSRDSGKSIAVQNGSTSNGGNLEARSWDGSNKFQWFFTEVGNNNNDDNSGGGSTASGIIGGRSNWKLNGFSGNLRVGNNDNGLDYRDDASLNNSHFFFENNGYAVFRCYPGNPTSGGSSNPRSETREQIGGGDGYWDGTTNTERSMKWRFRIEDLPPSGKLCFGQIHERSDKFDDIIRVQVEGNGGQNSGNVDLRILGYVTEEVEGSGRTINFNMKMDTEYYFELTMRKSVVRLYELNNSGNRVRELFKSENLGDTDENYFKAGCYLQSTKSSHSGSNTYGQVAIRDLRVSPND